MAKKGTNISELLKDDLKECDATFIQTAAYLSDIPEDNAVKADLIRLMMAKKREQGDSIVNKTITREKMNEFIEACFIVRDSLADEIEILEHENQVNPSRADQLKAQIAMGEKMKMAVDKHIMIFEMIAKVL